MGTKEISLPKESLAAAIREIERQSGEPTQLCIMTEKLNIFIGCYKGRSGSFHLKMYEKLNHGEDNPHLDLEGTYDSFNALEEAVQKEGLHIQGTLENGYFVCAKEGRYNVPAGEITPPLLSDEEEILIEEKEREPLFKK